LERSVLEQWWRHVNFFSEIIIIWRHYLARAPMSVQDLPDIRTRPIEKFFPTEKGARGYYWYYRTLVFAMFAEFSFGAAGREGWRNSIFKIREEKGLTDSIGEIWINQVENVLADFRKTKRAGVVIDVATTELWPVITRYMDNGVPTIMDVGYVQFRDRDETPQDPLIYISPLTHTQYDKSWPDRASILFITRLYLRHVYPGRLGRPNIPRPLNVSRPRVQELGGVIHHRPMTVPWVNPATNEPVDFIQVAPPEPVVDARPPPPEFTWEQFFERRRESNKRREENETVVEKQKRLSRAKDAAKINGNKHDGPSKKSTVFMWVQDPEDTEATMHKDPGGIWRRVRVNRAEVDDVWGDFKPTQRLYDPFHNEWDLCVLLDVDPEDKLQSNDDDDDDDDEDNMYIARPVVSEEHATAFLDQLNVENSLANHPFSAIHLLASQIVLLAPRNLALWAAQTFGHCTPAPNQDRDFVAYHPDTERLIGFRIENTDRNSHAYRSFQEFVYSVVNGRINTPEFQALSDLAPGNPRYLHVDNGGLDIRCVSVVHNSPQHAPNGLYAYTDVNRTGYILKPRNDVSEFQPTWMLVIFEATTVVQIIRNGWGTSSMEALVRHLVRHGIQFYTLTTALNKLPDDIVEINKAPTSFQTLVPKPKGHRFNAADYTEYVSVRNAIVVSPHGKAAFRMGGIIWRLAMQSLGNLSDLIDKILDGPVDMGAGRSQYFVIEGTKYYDETIYPAIADTLCGMYGNQLCKYDYWVLSIRAKSIW
jgi:hypothetical protein